MLLKTSGIFLHKIKHSDSALIAKIYTEEAGLQSFYLREARSKKKGARYNFLQPLALVEVVYYRKDSRTLHKVKELKPEYNFKTLPFDFAKSSIALFLAEVVFKTVQEEEKNPALFRFLHKNIMLLDHLEENVGNFHLVFLARLAGFLGIAPQDNYAPERTFFDVREGAFVPVSPAHRQYLAPPASETLHQILGMNFAALEHLKINKPTRKMLLKGLMSYYKEHLDHLQEIKSFAILEEVINS